MLTISGIYFQDYLQKNKGEKVMPSTQADNKQGKNTEYSIDTTKAAGIYERKPQ